MVALFLLYCLEMPASFDLTYILILIACILVALVIHEFMHAYVGHLLGDTTASDEGRVSLNPLRHIDPVMTVALPIITIVLFQVPILAAKPVPFNPENLKFDEFGAALIAAAGPFSNLVLAVLSALLFNFVLPVQGTLVHEIFSTFIFLNVALFVFNLLPVPPLDGSRVLYAFAPDPVRRVMEQLEPIGLFLIIGLILVGGGAFLTDLNQMVLNLLP